MLDGVEAIGAGEIERAEDQCIEDGEDNRIGANGEGQGEDCGSGKSWGFAQQAEAEAGVLQGGFEEIAAQRFMRFLAVALVGAELDAGAALSGCGVDAGALQILCALEDVGTEFLIHFLGGAGAEEEL